MQESDATIVRLVPADAPELLAGIARSVELHRPWVTPPSELAALEEYLGLDEQARISYGVRTAQDDLAGVVNINSVVRGAFQNGFLGFYALVPHEAKGHMRAALSAVIDAAFGDHGLHRLEANIQPGNARSIALVRGLGFRFEGESPRYLCVGEQWRDHLRFAITAEEWPPQAPFQGT